MPATRRLAAIVFTDVVGYTSLTQADEAGALELLRVQGDLVRPLLGSHHGRKVKEMGDGLLLEFRNARDAVEFAVELQRTVSVRRPERGKPTFQLRIGVHLGDVEPRGSDILGDAVNIASRVEPLAEPGGICLTSPVYDQVHRKVPYRFESLGPKDLKGVGEPITVYRTVPAPPTTSADAEASAVPRIAVLPFANISPDPKDEYFADGLTEELITVLSQARGLRVIARTSVGQYKGTTKPVTQIGSELGVSSVLEGSVRKAGDRLRIAVQLIDVKTEEHRWAETYDRRLDNVFAIQAEVAERTAHALKVELLGPEREAMRERPTPNMAAYELYLRGLQFSYGRLGSAGSEDEALRCFEGAIREDPRFASAHASLANVLLGAMGERRARRDVLPRIRVLVDRALELDPRSALAHTAAGNLAFQGDLDWPRAEAELRTAIALNPSEAAARFWYGFLLSALQRFDEAKQQFVASLRLDPLQLWTRLNLVTALALMGDSTAAVAAVEEAVTLFGASPRTRAALASAYAIAGRTNDALRTVEPLGQEPDLQWRALHALWRACYRQPDAAREVVRAWERGTNAESLPRAIVASLYAVIGERSTALRLLEEDSRDGERNLWAHYQSPFLDPLRKEPRFLALLEGMHLPTTLTRPATFPYPDPP